MGNLFASTGLGDEKPHERDVEYCGLASRRPYERQNENPEITAVHTVSDSMYVSLLDCVFTVFIGLIIEFCVGSRLTRSFLNRPGGRLGEDVRMCARH